jgi:hypothetical protein
MHTSRLFRKAGSLLLATSLLGTSIAPAQAAMVGTSQVLAAEQGSLDRARLTSLLEREDLQRQLAAMGVDVQQARDRVAGLTDAEIAQLNHRIGARPAGGDTVLGVFVLLLLILVITDLLGVTDVYPFVHPAK